MQIQFTKNIQFTRLVKADGRLREFNFRKYRGDEGELLFQLMWWTTVATVSFLK